VAGRPTEEELDELRRHFEIERELADRLRSATAAERRDLYPRVYEELFRRVELAGNEEAQRAQVGLLLRLLEPFLTGCRTFLEIGAGTCDLSLALAPRIDRVWAVDAVAPSLDVEDLPPAFSFVIDRELDEVVPAGEVDAALSCHFIEHLHPDDVGVHLETVLGKLTPGGVYVVVTPNRLYGPHDISRHFSAEPVGLHLREYSHGDLVEELRAAGFDRVGVIGGIGELPKPAAGARVRAAEGLLEALPRGLCRWLLDRAPRHPPFRPLEQVKVAAYKPERG
jgi:SAM-dependent methyltransferase